MLFGADLKGKCALNVSVSPCFQRFSWLYRDPAIYHPCVVYCYPAVFAHCWFLAFLLALVLALVFSASSDEPLFGGSMEHCGSG
jgi:hypothetical protein